MLSFETDSFSAKDTEQAGARLASGLKESGKANTFIAMYGDLGAGKTAFVRGLASVVTPSAHVCSPTYNLVNEYDGEDIKLCHFDMYRITSDDDLYSIGFYDYTDCMIAAEWCENIEYALPESYIRVDIVKTGEDSRRISVREINNDNSCN